MLSSTQDTPSWPHPVRICVCGCLDHLWQKTKVQTIHHISQDPTITAVGEEGQEGHPSQDLQTITQLEEEGLTNLDCTKDNYSIVMICLSFVNSNYLINKEQNPAT